MIVWWSEEDNGFVVDVTRARSALSAFRILKHLRKISGAIEE